MKSLELSVVFWSKASRLSQFTLFLRSLYAVFSTRGGF